MLAPSRSGRRAARPLANSAYAEKSVAISTAPSGRRRPVTTIVLSNLSGVSRRARSKRCIEHEQLTNIFRRDQPEQASLVDDDQRGTIAVLHASERDVGQLRPRPSEIPRLVEVAGYSYPSGHSLASAAILTTAAILVWEQTPRWRCRLLGVAFVGALVAAIGASRVYLGVHYPTDVAAGISVGAAWALLVGAASRRLREPGPSSIAIV